MLTEYLNIFKDNLMNILIFLGGMCVILAVMVLVTSNISRSRKVVVFMLEVSSFLLILAIYVSHAYEGVPGQFAYWMAKISKFCDSAFCLCAISSFNL